MAQMQKHSDYPIRYSHTPVRETITPFHVNVGSRGRVNEAFRHKLLDGASLVRGGRIDTLFGVYKHEKKDGSFLDVPVVIYETQMGMSAVDMIMGEMVHFSCVEPVYKFNGKEIYTGGKIIEIRAGTSGGCNTAEFDGEVPVLRIGDIVSATSTIGTSGTILQAEGFLPTLNYYAKGTELMEFTRKNEAMGGKITDDGFLEFDSHEKVVIGIAAAAGNMGLNAYLGKAFSKESLDCERDELFVKLRNEHGVLASEMEQLQAGYIAAKAKTRYNTDVMTGMVAGVIGTVPGAGYPTNKKEEKLKAETEMNVVKVALGAIGIIAEELQLER